MSENKGPSALDPARPVAGANRSGSAMLVAQAGLAPRQVQAGGVVGAIGPLVRAIHGWIATYFAAVMVVLIVLAIGLTAVQHGITLMGEQVKNALVLGAIYALVAIGYTMVYGIIELINFAHGDVFTASGFYAFGFASMFHLDSLATGSFGGLILALVIVFPLSMIAAGITGALIEFVAYRRLRDAPRLAPLITAIGVSFLIEGVMLVIEGPDNVTTHMASWINGQAFMIAGVSVGYTDLFVIGMALVLMFALGAFVRPYPARQGDALDRAGPYRRAALRHQHQSHDLGDVLHRIGARCGGRDHLQHQLRRSQMEHRVPPGHHRVHRGCAWRYRQHRRGRRRRFPHRHHLCVRRVAVRR